MPEVHSGCYIAVCEHAAGKNRDHKNESPGIPQLARRTENDVAELGDPPRRAQKPQLVPLYFDFFQAN